MTEIVKSEPQSMIVSSLDDIMRISKIFYESKLFFDTGTEAQAIVKVMAGHEIGMPPFASMNGIDIIRGKVCIKPSLLSAKLKGSDKYDYRIIEQSNTQCSIDFLERGLRIGTVTFTMQDAQKMGLHDKDNWKKQPAVMLYWRALSKGIRQFCPDLYGGTTVYTREEVEVDTKEIVEDAPEILAEKAVIDPEPPKAKPLSGIQKKNIMAIATKNGFNKEQLAILIESGGYGKLEELTNEYYDDIVRFVESAVVTPPPTDTAIAGDALFAPEPDPQEYGR